MGQVGEAGILFINQRYVHVVAAQIEIKSIRKEQQDSVLDFIG